MIIMIIINAERATEAGLRRRARGLQALLGEVPDLPKENIHIYTYIYIYIYIYTYIYIYIYIEREREGERCLSICLIYYTILYYTILHYMRSD